MDGFLSALETILVKVFGSILEPVLIAYLQVWWEIFKNVFGVFFGILLYYAYITVLRFIDILEAIFGIFAGTENVTFDGQKMPFLDVFFRLDSVSKVFFWLTIIGMTLTVIFSIYATIKSISDMSLENKNPISKVLSNCMKSMLMFAIIPFLSLFLLRLSSTMIISIDQVFLSSTYLAESKQNGSEVSQPMKSPSLGTTIFIITTADAKRGEGKGIMSAFLGQDREYTYGMNLSPWKDYANGKKVYYDLETVQKDFTLLDINYLMGFLSAIFLMCVLSGAIVVFIKRAFEILVLYLVAPLFASTIPLDDGATFKKWRELYITKFFTAFGSVIAMRLYLMIIPVFMSSDVIQISDASVILDTVIKLTLICGGSLAVFKSTSLITAVMNEEEANREAQSMRMAVDTAKKAASMAAQAGSAVATGGASAAAGGAAKLGAGAAKMGSSAQKFGDAANKALRSYNNHNKPKEKESE